MTNTVRASVGQTGRDRAIVMGGSIAGLTAARVLSDHFREVILVERDHFGELGEHRRGVPQGRHTHGLLAGGLRALEDFSPGLFAEARRAGGLGVDLTRDAYWCFEGGEYRRFATSKVCSSVAGGPAGGRGKTGKERQSHNLLLLLNVMASSLKGLC
jgi:hypothetical protein